MMEMQVEINFEQILVNKNKKINIKIRFIGKTKAYPILLLTRYTK